jgi:hypothetical protein
MSSRIFFLVEGREIMRRIITIFMLAALVYPVMTRADEPATYSISAIRQHLDELNDQRVRIDNVVCFVETGRTGDSTTWVQDPEGGPWSGTSIIDNDHRLLADRGDTVTAVGIVSGSDGFFTLGTSSETEYPPEVTGVGTVPEPIDLTCAVACEPMYIDCLIRLQNLEVTSVPDEFGNIDITDGTGPYKLLLSITMTPPDVGFVYGWMTGLNDDHWEECKIRPRDEDDWGDELPATPTPTIYLGVQIDMPDSVHPGDPFYVDGILNNPSQPMEDVPVFFILNIASDFWFWPTWISSDTGVDFNYIDVADGTTVIHVIDSMTWPETGTLAMDNLVFYGAMLESDFSAIMGGFAEASWQFGP